MKHYDRPEHFHAAGFRADNRGAPAQESSAKSALLQVVFNVCSKAVLCVCRIVLQNKCVVMRALPRPLASGMGSNKRDSGGKRRKKNTCTMV